jgi:DNA modification methylase
MVAGGAVMQPYYDDGAGIQIFLGDCREVLPGLEADVVITDPPYGVGITAFVDDFSTVGALDVASGRLAAVFMSPRRILALMAVLPSWHFERLLWMHKTADMAAPWRGWCMNSEAIVIASRPGAVWPKPTSYRADTYDVGPWERAGHPNGKPLSVVRDLVRRLAIPDAVVLDPFTGSGTVLRAAKDLGRRAIGVEIEERYAEIAANRLRQMVLPLDVTA